MEGNPLFIFIRKDRYRASCMEVVREIRIRLLAMDSASVFIIITQK